MNNESAGCKVTVIVPVYRVEGYLDRCMRSLIRQTLKEIEIICICEAEDPSYPSLLEYAKRDSRVRVIKKKNTGVSSARNAGIRVAVGEYIAFVDADDWIEKYALNILYHVSKRYDAQILAYGIWPTVEPRGAARRMFKYSPNKNVMYHSNGMQALIYERGSRPYIGNKFYKREFLRDNNIVFDESIDIGEDQLLQFEAFERAERICFIKNKLYHYDIERSTSAMNTCAKQQESEAEDKDYKLLAAVMELKEKKYANKYNKEYISWILYDYAWTINHDIHNISDTRKNMIHYIQGQLQKMSAGEYISDLPGEYQELCNRFMEYSDTDHNCDHIEMPYYEFEAYAERKICDMRTPITVSDNYFRFPLRLHELFAFHEFRHMATKALVRFGLF